MSDHSTDFVGSIDDAIVTAIRAAIPDAQVQVAGGGGHYRIAVTSTVFAGQGLLAQQRLVLSSIKHLLAGARPPVHAVDSLETRTP
ncbi:MAG: BolA/IbaG family iron-sulfur metabolism protein [Myxococcales bacterium]|nr:BolA/IbaG family iron-sulfur metabolism protein [Myxococcales bacterium]